MATEMVERLARRLFNARHEGQIVGVAWEEPWPDEWKKSPYRNEAISILQELMEPTEEQWDGLARQIIFWMDMSPKTPRALFAHLERSGYEIPQWLRDEPEMRHLDHVPSKGTRAVLVYRAMISSAIGGG